jgi:hypothetical protein
MKLLRSEIHAAQTAQWLGRVRLHRPLSFSALTFSALVLGSLLCLSVPGARSTAKPS